MSVMFHGAIFHLEASSTGAAVHKEAFFVTRSNAAAVFSTPLSLASPRLTDVVYTCSKVHYFTVAP